MWPLWAHLYRRLISPIPLLRLIWRCFTDILIAEAELVRKETFIVSDLWKKWFVWLYWAHFRYPGYHWQNSLKTPSIGCVPGTLKYAKWPKITADKRLNGRLGSNCLSLRQWMVDVSCQMGTRYLSLQGPDVNSLGEGFRRRRIYMYTIVDISIITVWS